VAGTEATFCGLPVLEARLVRAPGTEPSGGTLRLLLPGFPAGWSFPAAVREAAPSLGGATAVAPSVNTARVPTGVAQVMGLVADLVAGEVADREWGPVVVRELVVRAVEADRALGVVDLQVADARVFWTRGALDRWVFNRKKANGDLAEDTLRANGDAWSLEQVVREVVAPATWGSPEVRRLPASWSTLRPALELPRRCSPKAALDALCEQFRAVVTLGWDGSVSIWAEGEGDLPPLPDDQVAEDLYTREHTFAPPVLLVVGGVRIATVAIDGWEPVLDLDGQIVPLEEGVALLLRGDTRTDPSQPMPRATEEEMAAVRRHVLRSAAGQARPDWSPRMVRILGQQAYRLWRIPGAETFNRHLLPLLDRAETDAAGHRLPVLVETYRWRLRVTPLRATTSGPRPAGESRAQIEADIERLRALLGSVTNPRERDQIEARIRDLEARATATGAQSQAERDQALALEQLARVTGSAPNRTTSSLAASAGEILDPILNALLGLGAPQSADGTDARFTGLLDRALNLAQADSDEPVGAAGVRAGAAEAERYLRALERAGDRGKEVLEAYRRLVQAQAAVAREGGLLYTGDLDLAVAEALLEEAKANRGDLIAAGQADNSEGVAKARRALLERAERLRADRLRTGGDPTAGRAEPELALAAHLVNDPRLPDPDARVYDANAGVVQTGAAAGWVVDPAVPSATDTELDPMPVRVVFGATLRPRLPGARVQTGGQALDNVVPEVALTDRETYYETAWEVASPGQVSRVTRALAPGEALTIPAPDLEERITLNGTTNAGDLDREAERLAREASRRPMVVEGERRTYLRPWLVEPSAVVAEVTLALQPGIMGWRTSYVSGTARGPAAGGGQTRTRAPAQVRALREQRRAEDP